MREGPSFQIRPQCSLQQNGKTHPGTTCSGLCSSSVNATFATSQSCRKRETLSLGPCSPMTCSASLPALFSLELLDETKEPLSDRQEFSSDIMCNPTTAHAFTASTGMLGPNRTSSLMTIGSSFKRKKRESSPYGPYLPGTFHCDEVVRSRTVPSIQKRPQDLFPQR